MVVSIYTFCCAQLSRHTNRAPLATYKNKTNHIVWPRGLGELTDQGIWNAYRAGQALRERYLGFLHPLQRYTPSEIDVSSTLVDRCYQTAGYMLAGMYPPNEEQTWNKDLKWQPVPIKTCLSKDHYEVRAIPTAGRFALLIEDRWTAELFFFFFF